VKVLNEHQVAFGDLSGNNRLDTYANLTAQPAVGMLCIVPGVEETLRLNGRARISTDPAVLAAVAFDDRTPKVAVVIDVDECYIHCGKALRRAGVWDTDSWPAEGERPSPAAILTAHGYVHTLWEHGGE
jgi:predicted pyridoxine 5'-phosphate oxidase superfamily flavin-nucleotide-binding protein